MMFRTLLVAILMGALTALATPAHATVCYVGEHSEGTLEADGGKASYQAGAVVEHCAGTVVAVGGKVDFCHLNNLGQFTCKPLKPGDRVAVEEAASKPQWVAVLQVLKDFVNPQPHRELGLKRLRDTGAPVDGLPLGEVLLPPESLEFSGPRAGLKAIDRLTVSRKDAPGAPLFSHGAPAPTVEVPRALLTPGGAYRWKLADGSENLDGAFTVAEAEDQKDFEEELAMLQDPEGDASTRYLVRAVLAKQYGYTYDMFLALEAARDSQKDPEPQAIYGAAPNREAGP